MSCVLVINDLLLFRVSLPLLLYPKGVGLQGRWQVSYYNDPNQDSLSLAFLIYKSCVLAPTDRVMLSWAACLGHMESSTRWAESLWIPPSTIRVNAVRYL
jgi:hypothetical protein